MDNASSTIEPRTGLSTFSTGQRTNTHGVTSSHLHFITVSLFLQHIRCLIATKKAPLWGAKKCYSVGFRVTLSPSMIPTRSKSLYALLTRFSKAFSGFFSRQRLFLIVSGFLLRLVNHFPPLAVFSILFSIRYMRRVHLRSNLSCFRYELPTQAVAVCFSLLKTIHS